MAHNSQNVTPHHLTQDCVCLHHYCFQCTSQNQLHRKLKNPWSQWHPHATWRTHQYTCYSSALHEEHISSTGGTYQHYMKNSSAVLVHVLLTSAIRRTCQQYWWYSSALCEELVSSTDGTHQHLQVLICTHATHQHNKIPPYFCYSLLCTLPLIPAIHNHKHQLQLCFNVQQIICPWNF
jgi:hypothetical protein